MRVAIPATATTAVIISFDFVSETVCAGHRPRREIGGRILRKKITIINTSNGKSKIFFIPESITSVR